MSRTIEIKEQSQAQPKFCGSYEKQACTLFSVNKKHVVKIFVVNSLFDYCYMYLFSTEYQQQHEYSNNRSPQNHQPSSPYNNNHHSNHHSHHSNHHDSPHHKQIPSNNQPTGGAPYNHAQNIVIDPNIPPPLKSYSSVASARNKPNVGMPLPGQQPQGVPIVNNMAQQPPINKGRPPMKTGIPAPVAEPQDATKALPVKQEQLNNAKQQYIVQAKQAVAKSNSTPPMNKPPVNQMPMSTGAHQEVPKAPTQRPPGLSLDAGSATTPAS